MNTETAIRLNEITSDFYRRHCDSFSATRQAPWNGWKRCLGMIDELASDRSRLSVFDLACGNLRFEAYLAEALPDVSLVVHAVDNCDELVCAESFAECAEEAGEGSDAGRTVAVEYQSADVIRALSCGEDVGGCLRAPACDLSVSFGFMHHVPTRENREAVLDALIGKTRPGGLVVVSFWQFMRNEALAEKARGTHERALCELGLPELDEGDYLLGWKDTVGAYRYCHSFSEEEIDLLAESVAARATLAARFTADGRTDDLNTYLVFRVRQ